MNLQMTLPQSHVTFPKQIFLKGNFKEIVINIEQSISYCQLTKFFIGDLVLVHVEARNCHSSWTAKKYKDH